MARTHALTYALNAGAVDPEVLTRIDLEKMRLAGEHPVNNWLPRVTGPMTIAPGSENLVRIPDDAESRLLRFWRDSDDDRGSYMLVLSPGEMRILTQDDEFATVPSVATTISAVGWADESISAASASVAAGVMTLVATDQDTAILRRACAVAGGDQATEHVLKVIVTRGPVHVRIGTTAGATNIQDDAELANGTHFIAFVPNAATVYIDVRSNDPVERIVASVALQAAGVLVVPTPWDTLDRINAQRTWQSLDVIFVGDGVGQQREIQNRNKNPLSWGIAVFQPNNGPFVFGNRQISMTIGATSGNTTVTAAQNYFVAGHTGVLLELTHTGNVVTATLNDLEETSGFVTITGVTNGRIFSRTAVASSFIGTLVLERSFEPSDPTIWTVFQTYVNGAANFPRTNVDDDQDNVTVHYRFRVIAYTSGSVDVTLEFASQTVTGIARINEVTSPTVVQIEVLTAFGKAAASRVWRVGDWSGIRGWPRTPCIHDGRMHWFRGDEDYASVPDDFINYDDTIEGDSAPFVRSVGSGGERGVVWALSTDRLIVGTSRSEMVIAASELDAALTRTAYTVRRPTRRGSADVAAVEHDTGIMFAQRSGRRLYEMTRASNQTSFSTRQMSRLNPTAYSSGIDRLAVQQQPDLRVWAQTADGALQVLTYEPDDEVVAITTRTISGALVEDIETLPGIEQDYVYTIARRGTARYIERFAGERAQTNPATCALLDGHKVLTGSIAQITGATHFAGETVQVWADGARHPDVTLDGSGVAALTGGPFARVVYGKAYDAVWQSVKLEYAAQLGTALGQIQQVKGAALILHKSCMDGIEIGPDFITMDPMPEIIDGAERTENQFFDHYEHEITPINSEWQTDARFCIRVDSAEGPVTIQGVVFDVETRDGVGNA